MKRGRLPLTALRSFEAAGRHLSFSRAAEELFVSQAAVSRQVRDLEELLARPLFERLHRKVALTEAGKHLLVELTTSFDAIDRRLDEIIGRPVQHVVTVSVEPSFAAAWLAPRLHLFNAARADIDVAIDAAPRLIDFRGHAADFAIRHSLIATSWPRTQSRHLADCGSLPVMAPELLASGPPIRTPADLCQYALLHEDNRDGWSDWFRQMGVSGGEPLRGPIFPDCALAMQSAARGHGVALGSRLLSAPDLETGRLVAPFAHELPYGAYWIVAPDLDRLAPSAAALADWLVNAVRSDVRP
ncbi:LysR substrate-binding domain-containing protein [Mesorhizobium sp. LHD-90]|uniref:LysR substrate-binding domain-containing protein n=1 Tax=Mesorhizobium sp. LHD-90 TaxID=3071414 RepID=UPI0027DFF879|nr:LysR substrate-binding domain-containing protein [Mesorhizobium sp. LHD-90]MDQ6437196.1 LysR substrate-binding domain-containing protein [Mesorhizobium sp. LHD-90]